MPGDVPLSTSTESLHSGDRRPREVIEPQGASQCRVIGKHAVGARVSGIILWNSTDDCSSNGVTGNVVGAPGTETITLRADGAERRATIFVG